MNSYRDQYRIGNTNITPIITIVCNFTKPTEEKPSLLTFEEVNTLFHEFGHALHGLFSDCTYRKLSGTSTPRDFVELPSQIMENWASEPEVMKMYARHYKTGEVIPQGLIDKIKASEHFNQGFAQWEKIKKFKLVPTVWGIDTGELTPTLKLKRRVVHKKFEREIKEIYEEAQ